MYCVGPRRGIPARGIPINKMMENNQTVSVHSQLIKEPVEILQEYESIGGSITAFSQFGYDPLNGKHNLISRRDEIFYEHAPPFNETFHATINGNFTLFRRGLLVLISTTSQLC